MPAILLSIKKSTRAIIHIDGDAFFASCEQAMNPLLRGKPVITGLERGIVSAASYEAKRMGVSRGTPLRDVKKICPEAIILASNYEAYSIFSCRMYEIVRRYTSKVEEYSIDECFADITGLHRSLHMSYEKIARSIKEDLKRELGMTFSIGLASTKVLAKIGSKWDKPDGLTVIPNNKIDAYLSKVSVGKVWGIGSQTSILLMNKGVRTAYDLATQTEDWVKATLSKPYQEIYYELRGVPIFEINTEDKESYASISKTKTFTPATNDKSYVFAKLSKNIENACIKLRHYNLRTAKIFLFIKTAEFLYRGLEIELPLATNTPEAIVKIAEERFGEIWKMGVKYRATGVRFYELKSGAGQPDLFGAHASVQKVEKIFASIDQISARFGKHAISLATSLPALNKGKRIDYRDRKPLRYDAGLLKGETDRRHLNIPIIGEV